MHTIGETSVTHRQEDSLWTRVHEAVFGFKEAGLKLGVTTWVSRFMQSVGVTDGDMTRSMLITSK